jgi:hypothetical protein
MKFDYLYQMIRGSITCLNIYLLPFNLDVSNIKYKGLRNSPSFKKKLDY